MFNKKIFCERLKAARKGRNLTLEQLGSQLEVTKQTVSRWEKGERYPALDVLYNIAEVLDVSSDYLLGLSNNPNR